MSEALRQLIAEIQDTFRNEPDKAKATFISQSQLQDGFHSEVALRDHTLTVCSGGMGSWRSPWSSERDAPEVHEVEVRGPDDEARAAFTWL